MAGIQDKKLTVKEVVYILSIASAFFANNYSLKMEIREQAMAFNSEKRVVDLRLASLESQDLIHDKTLEMVAHSMGEMIEVNSPRITKNRKN